jgi:hypothetical protein
VNIESTAAIGTNVENLRKPELITAIHPQVACHEDEYTSWKGSCLNVRVKIRKLYGLEAKGFYFFSDAFECNIGGAGVGHGAGLAIEADDVGSICLHGRVVLFQEDGSN